MGWPVKGKTPRPIRPDARSPIHRRVHAHYDGGYEVERLGRGGGLVMECLMHCHRNIEGMLSALSPESVTEIVSLKCPINDLDIRIF